MVSLNVATIDYLVSVNFLSFPLDRDRACNWFLSCLVSSLSIILLEVALLLLLAEEMRYFTMNMI